MPGRDATEKPPEYQLLGYWYDSTWEKTTPKAGMEPRSVAVEAEAEAFPLSQRGDGKEEYGRSVDGITFFHLNEEKVFSVGGNEGWRYRWWWWWWKGVEWGEIGRGWELLHVRLVLAN